MTAPGPVVSTRCSTDGCRKRVKARGLCSSHYEQFRRSPEGTAAIAADDLLSNTLTESPLASGISYRQLDYWTTKGWLKADRPSPGSGRRRRWPSFELDVAERMKLLIEAGVAAPVAATAARSGMEFWLTDQVKVSVVVP